ncbi:MAG: helix-turn-helix transcriptional regulator [Eubacteriales bacterium]|nr:helix-turn-helix transcriptional regulator [Eubacteriales bacterium]
MENDKIQKELTEKLAVLLPQIRKAYGVSQSRLGSLVGKSRQHISKVERGLAPLGWDTCLAILLLACKKNKNTFIDVAGDKCLKEFEAFIEGAGFDKLK